MIRDTISITDEYLRDLEPQRQRYDVTVDQDFVISVLPNGIKTWAFIYDYQGRQRRKTLGVYPDMGRDDAHKALENARAMVERLETTRHDIVEEKIQGERPAVLSPQHHEKRQLDDDDALENSGRRGWLLTGGVLAVAAAAIATYALVTRDRAEAPLTANGASPVVTPSPQRSSPARSTSPASGRSTGASTDRPASTAPVDTARVAESGEEPPAIDTAPSAAPKSSDPAPADTTPTVTPPIDTRPVDSKPVGTQPIAARSADTSVADPGTSDARPVEPPAAPVRVPVTQPQPPPETRVATAQAIDPPVAQPTNIAVDDSDTASGPVVATAIGGSVPRAILTSDVVDLEPTDTLGPIIEASASGYRTVFYFTELREFSEGQIVHRWELDGRLIADVPLKVGGSWRWRTYSSKDLLPGMTGEWTVSVIDADGEVMGREVFTYSP